MDCPLCCDSFDQETRIPRILACGHTFCKQCISSIKKSSVIGDITIECPNCRHSVCIKSLDDLPKNYLLSEMLENSKKNLSSQSAEWCSLHAQKRISYYCKTCFKPLCSKCLLLHNGHDKFSIDDQGKQYIYIKRRNI